MSKNRTPPDPAELREAEDGFRRWLLPAGCSDLIDVGSPADSESPAEPLQCEYCGVMNGPKTKVITFPAAFAQASAICKSCASLWQREWNEVAEECGKCFQDESKSTAERYMAYKAIVEPVRRRVLKLIAERKKMN